MTDKELRKLKRKELLEMLIFQTKENERLQTELDEARKKAEDREIAIGESGTLAEASLQLNGVFAAADAAAKDYLERIHAQNEDQQGEYDRIVGEAQAEAEALKANAAADAGALTAEARAIVDKARERAVELTAEAETAAVNAQIEAKKITDKAADEAGSYTAQSRDIVDNANKKAAAVMEEARKKATAILAEAQAEAEAKRKEADGYWEDVSFRLNALMDEREGLRELLSKTVGAPKKEE